MFRRRVKRAAESIKRIPPGRQYYIGPARRASCVYIRNTIFPPYTTTTGYCTLLLVRITISCTFDLWVNYTIFARRHPANGIILYTTRDKEKYNVTENRDTRALYRV